jgi:hypothetical protein
MQPAARPRRSRELSPTGYEVCAQHHCVLVRPSTASQGDDLPAAVIYLPVQHDSAVTGVNVLFTVVRYRFCNAARAVLHSAEPQHPGFFELALRHRYPLRHLSTAELTCHDEVKGFLAEVHRCGKHLLADTSA